MLSEEAATRLAVSPALASIAQGVSAVATKDDLTEFLKNAKITLNTPTTTPLTLAPAPAAVEASSPIQAQAPTRQTRIVAWRHDR
mgnify:CR=1 FL=1